MKKFSWLLAGFLVIVLAGCEKASQVGLDTEDILLIEDFDAGAPPNYLGGNYGAWDKDPEDDSQWAEIFFDSDIRKGGEGYSLRIEYDVDSDQPAFNGAWMKLEGESFEPYEELVFSIKGDSEAGFTKRLKVELKNMSESGSYMLTGITDKWQEIVIPLDNFRGLRDFSEMDEFVIVFEDSIATAKEGIIYIDDIYVR